jgi:tRNA(fMet)-specific endonuclease VapC
VRHLLDTDWLIDYLTGDLAARTLIASLLPDGVAISVVTYMEIFEGIEASPSRREDEREFRTALRSIDVLPVNRSVARRAATIRFQLRAGGRSAVRRRALDILIAATALVHDLTLVTRNISDYQGIPGLKLR